MKKANFGWSYPAGAENDPNAPWNQNDPEICDCCDGDGYVIESCCGDNIKGNDIDLCPTCGEHCGMEKEECSECDGTGYVKEDEDDFHEPEDHSYDNRDDNWADYIN